MLELDGRHAPRGTGLGRNMLGISGLRETLDWLGQSQSANCTERRAKLRSPEERLLIQLDRKTVGPSNPSLEIDVIIGIIERT